VERWSELAHDQRGGDNTQKRLYAKLLSSRVAIVEEMGQTQGIQRILETSTVKQLTGGGEISGADVYKSEVHGEIRFKMPTVMNQAPHIEPDAACKRRVQVFPFRAVFDEMQHPGCIARGMVTLPNQVSREVLENVEECGDTSGTQ
jgi:phage/plasmid-associated DNA primase